MSSGPRSPWRRIRPSHRAESLDGALWQDMVVVPCRAGKGGCLVRRTKIHEVHRDEQGRDATSGDGVSDFWVVQTGIEWV